MKMRERRKIKVKKHTRVLHDGKKTSVKRHHREIKIPLLNKMFKERITKGDATKLFEKRSEKSKKMDVNKSSKRMFAVPNRMWAEAPNIYDIWGLDGFDPPEINELPLLGLPFQIVRFNGKKYTADRSGIFTLLKEKTKKTKKSKEKTEKQEIKPIKYDPMDKEKQEKFEEITNKKAIWNGKTTKVYRKWLEKESELEYLSKKLDYTKNTNKLYEIQELYNKLNLNKEDLKKLMLKLYNNVYKNKIESYTKDFNEFYDHRFYDNIERKIRVEEKRLKKLQKDPKKSKEASERYESSELRLYNIMSQMESKGYFDFNINEIRGKMKHLKDDEIIHDLIEELHSEGGDIGEGEVDYTSSDKKETQKHEAMRGYYEQRAHDEYLGYLTQEAVKI